ncbi:DUF2164 domain-containing protein [Paenibacillus selenitireducens]|uniref:DUF2164 domain-containing protein n=1 Tax=Paenibacillus selenitireducens TaxID=1324314 RepID=UPI0026C73CD7
MIIPMKLPKEQKEMIIRNVQMYFENERDETIGDLAAEGFIDFMIKELGPHLYNKGIADARTVLIQKTTQLEDELYSLEKRIK